MRAVTLRHPWPWAFLRLDKNVENRGWTPNVPPGERIALHAGRAPTDKNDDYLLEIVAAIRWMRDRGIAVPDGLMVRDVIQPSSAIVMVVTYHSATNRSPSRWAVEGSWHWELWDRTPLPTPVPCKGAQGLWTLPDDVERAVLAQVA